MDWIRIMKQKKTTNKCSQKNPVCADRYEEQMRYCLNCRLLWKMIMEDGCREKVLWIEEISGSRNI